MQVAHRKSHAKHSVTHGVAPNSKLRNMMIDRLMGYFTSVTVPQVSVGALGVRMVFNLAFCSQSSRLYMGCKIDEAFYTCSTSKSEVT